MVKRFLRFYLVDYQALTRLGWPQARKSLITNDLQDGLLVYFIARIFLSNPAFIIC